MSKTHTHYLGLILAASGGVPSFEGPFLTYGEAKDSVQKMLADDPDIIGGVVPFDVVEAAAPEPAPAPAPEPPDGEPPAPPGADGAAA